MPALHEFPLNILSRERDLKRGGRGGERKRAMRRGEVNRGFFVGLTDVNRGVDKNGFFFFDTANRNKDGCPFRL